MTDKTFIPLNINTMFTALDALDPEVSQERTNIPTIKILSWDTISTLEKTNIIAIMTTAGFVAID